MLRELSRIVSAEVWEEEAWWKSLPPMLG
jgi:hypothetical protein